MEDHSEQNLGDVTEGGSGQVPAPLSAVPPIVVQFLENQKQELTIRAQEAEVQRLRIANERLEIEKAHEYSMKAVDLQAQDRREERESDGKGLGRTLRLVGLVVLGLFGFFGYALYANKDQLILEILRIVLYAGGGGGVGYAVGKSKRDENSNASKKDDAE